MDNIDALRFQVIETDVETGRRLLGEADLDIEGVLTVASADAGTRDRLERLVALVNGKPVLHVSVSPPAGAPRFALYSRGVARSDPRFFEALQAFLARHYGVFLSHGGPIDEAPFPATELHEPDQGE